MSGAGETIKTPQKDTTIIASFSSSSFLFEILPTKVLSLKEFFQDFDLKPSAVGRRSR